MAVRFLVGDTFDVMSKLPDGSIDLVMTSPPFLGLRSYLPADHPDKGREIGSEATPPEFIDVLLDLTDEWARLLAPHGSICVELGDTFAGSGGAGGDYGDGGMREGQDKFDGSARRGRLACYSDQRGNPDGMRDTTFSGGNTRTGSGIGWPLDKSLTCIPALYAASLAYGRNLLNPAHTVDPWRVRNLVAWVRPNPPVGALGDKVRPATSYLTWACKARDRWFDLDAVRSQPSANTHPRLARGGAPRYDLPSQQRDGNWSTLATVDDPNPAGAPPLDWWKIVPGGYSGAHYAVYPVELCRIPIEASCPRRVCVTCGTPSRRIVENDADAPTRTVSAASEATERERMNEWQANRPPGQYQMPRDREGERTVRRAVATTGWTTCGCPGTDGLKLDGYHTGDGWRPGLVLDPFGGSGTTGVAASGLSRDAILIDIDERNADLARERLGMFLEVTEPGTHDVAVGGWL